MYAPDGAMEKPDVWIKANSFESGRNIVAINVYAKDNMAFTASLGDDDCDFMKWEISLLIKYQDWQYLKIGIQAIPHNQLIPSYLSLQTSRLARSILAPPINVFILTIITNISPQYIAIV